MKPNYKRVRRLIAMGAPGGLQESWREIRLDVQSKARVPLSSAQPSIPKPAGAACSPTARLMPRPSTLAH